MREHQPKRQEILERVNLYLDQEMSQEDEKSFLQQVRQDSEYKQVLESEQHFRNRLHNVVSSHRVSRDLVQAIREKIRIAPI